MLLSAVRGAKRPYGLYSNSCLDIKSPEHLMKYK